MNLSGPSPALTPRRRMPARLTVLASGSSGNATLLEVDGFGLLIDCGLGPRILSNRLSAVGRSWKAVSAVLLTHTHTDHWNPLTLAQLRQLNVPLIAHPRHHAALSARDEHAPLRRAGLDRSYEAGTWFDLGPSLAAFAVRVPHDSDPTFAFRFEARDGSGWSLGFASDVGHITKELAAAFTGVDVLAVEYNHDVAMQRASGRPRILIERVLGANGHLSNAQAADLTRTVAGTGELRALVQLHLSRDCNRPELAAEAGRRAVAESAPAAEVVTSSQTVPMTPLLLVGRAGPRRTIPIPNCPAPSVQPSLPGLAAEAG